MNCDTAREMLGPYLDVELPDAQRAELEQHLQSCPGCTTELEDQRTMWSELDRLGMRSDVNAPPQLWSAIENRLDTVGPPSSQRRIISLFRRPMAVAASLAVLIGAGLFVGLWLGPGTPTARASSIDYTILLDGLAEDVNAAVRRFLNHYKAEPIAREAADAAAPELSYAVPLELPGGYRLEQAYSLQFGDDPGVAATYRRGDEPIVVFFHPPVDKENLGVHRHSPCIVGGRHGQKVEVGPWRLIHFTDPTTCHCLLSKLDEGPELFEIMAQIAPKFTESAQDSQSSHQH